MSKAAKMALLFIVFVDLLGQGLVFPIINAMIMEPSSTFLPHEASDATRFSSYGLVGGPLLGGFLSDPAIVGSGASLALPFYAALVLVIIGILLVLVFFKDIEIQGPREYFAFRPAEIFELLWRVTRYPLMMRVAVIFLMLQLCSTTFYIFVDNYLASRFGYGSLGGSMVMLTIGIAYPTILGLFAASVSDDEQGWVMGISTAVLTLVAGFMALLGGQLMSIDIRLPFYMAIAAAVIGAVLLRIVWRAPEIRQLVDA